MLKTTRLKALAAASALLLAATSLSLPSLAADGGDAPAGEGTNLALNLPEDKIAAYLEANDKTEYYMDESFPNASYGTAEGKGKAALVDGDLTGQMDWWGSYATHSFNLVLDFTTRKVINKVELTDFATGTKEQLAKKYTVYVGNSLEEIFGVTATPVATYERGEDDANATMKVAVDAAVGRYIRVCVDIPGVGNQMRVDELAVYGEEYVPNYANLLQDKPVSLYLTDTAAAQAEPVQLDKTAFDDAKRLALTDGAADADVTVDTQGKRLDIVYNLGKNTTLEEFGLTNAGKDTAAYVKQMAVYVATTADGVWEDDAKVASYDKPSTPDANVLLDVSGQEIKGRYVRFSVTAPADSGSIFTVAELAARGEDTQKLAITNMALNLPEAQILPYLEANDKSEYSLDEGFPNGSYGTAEGKGKAALVDGDLTGQMDWWGSYATHSFNLVLDFGDQRLMNKVELTDFTGGTQEQLAKKYTVYVGNSLTEVFGVTAMPVAVYTRGEEDADATMTLSFSPEIGQYIRVCIDEPGVGNQMRLNELAVYGADVDDVESTSTDPNVAVGFENKDYGIKVDILKLDGKDTFNDVRSMTVTPRDMTAEEKADLAEVYLLPFSKVYDIAFLDKDGKPVTDFGGRKFRWTFQIPKELIDTTSYLGIISQDGAEIVNADYVDDTLTFTDENDPPYTHYFVATGDPNANMGGGGYEPEEPIVPTGVGLPVSMIGLAAVSALTVLAIRKNRKGDK